MPAPEASALAGQWLEDARGDLRAAREAVDNEAFEIRHACWHAHQAAEKGLKALLILEQIEFPFTHDLAVLRDLLPDRHAVRQADLDLRELTRWGVETRYVGDPWPKEADSATAAGLAGRVLELVDADFEREAPE